MSPHTRAARARRPQRGYLDPGYLRTVERLISERREVEQVTPYELAERATVRTRDVADAITYWDHANAGTDLVGLLDATAWEGPWGE